MRTKDLFNFIRARHDVFTRRLMGTPKPWTSDPILQRYRFCNVYRELDTVTVWIRKNWREPYDKDPNLWFAMVVARLVNWPESLDDISHCVFNQDKVCWSPNSFVRAMDARKKAGEKVFTGAYMIHAGPAEGASKAAYLAKEVLTPMWGRRKELGAPGIWNPSGISTARLFGLHDWIMTNKDMGSFMAGQVVADVKFQTAWRSTTDWWSFAAPGPGSQRGLARVYNEAPDYRWNRSDGGHMWLECLHILQEKIDPLVNKAGLPRISAQDLQNCLCEFDKYERVRLGEGKPRSLYPGVQ